MCVCHCLHHHHLPPCTRPVTFAITYSYCALAPVDPTTNTPISPCADVWMDSSAAAAAAATSNPGGGATTNPCASGGCLVAPECSSGECRLRDLRGLWVCCRCHRGGNSSRWCRHRKKGSPDTFCYHTVCQGCKSEYLA